MDRFWAIKSITIGKMIINKFWGYLNIDPENHQFLMETSLPTPICQGL